MNLLVIGFGKMGMLHAATLRRLSGVSSVSIAEPSDWLRATLREFQADFKIYAGVDEALGQRRFDGAVIAAPTAAHSVLLSQTLKAELPTLIEKPLVPSLREALALEELLTPKLLRDRVSVGHCLRFAPPFVKAQALLSKGIGGKVLGVQATMFSSDVLTRSGGWRFKRQGGSGVLLDLGSHLVDMARALFGPPRRVRGKVWSVVSECVEDAFEADWEYEDFLVQISSSWSRAGVRKASLEIRVQLEHGTLEIDDESVRLVLTQESRGLHAGEHRFEITRLETPVEFDLAGPFYTRQARAWLDAVHNRLPLSNGWDENLKNLQLIDAIRSSENRWLPIR